jgi:hypothetical protein
MGITDGTLNALACPAAEGSPQTVSFSMLIPNEASGLGSLGIIVNASDASGSTAVCLNLTVTL